MKQVETFRQLGDETRMRALALMALEQELCVREFVAALALSQPKISRHLAALRDAGLVVARRDAQWVFYSISASLSDWQQRVIAAAVDGVMDEAIVKEDLNRLETMDGRPQRGTGAGKRKQHVS